MCVGAVEGTLESLDRLDVQSASIEELAETVKRVEALRDKLAFHSARMVAHFEALKGHERYGFADVVSWLKSFARVTGGAAMERLRVGRKLGELPSTAAALEQGK